MWIRTQDKKALWKINGVAISSRYDGVWDLVCSPQGKILGSYKTKEKAIDVLNDLQQFTSNENYTFQMPIGTTERMKRESTLVRLDEYVLGGYE